MNPSLSSEQRPRQAMIAWGVFIFLAVLINGTVPFVLGYDLHAWSNSIVKVVLFSLLIYAQSVRQTEQRFSWLLSTNFSRDWRPLRPRDLEAD